MTRENPDTPVVDTTWNYARGAVERVESEEDH